MADLHFDGIIEDINGWLVVRFPADESAKLPSRSQVMVKGTINEYEFQVPVEPDGMGSHWLHIDKTMQAALQVHAGDMVTIDVGATKDWFDPDIPADVQKGIVDNPETTALWQRVTPMARWEWLRWIGSTKNPDTRAKRIVVSVSKLKNGLRRPCCFNRSMCCVPDVSKNGVLLERQPA